MAVQVDVGTLSRTLRIRYHNSVGSAVHVRVDGVSMVFTAAHVVNGMAAGDNVGIRYQNEWRFLAVAAIARCEVGLDVCAFRLAGDDNEGIPEEHLADGMPVGQEIAYCGFPLNLEMQGMPGLFGRPMGFVKGGIFSGILQRPDGVCEYLFDTINNKGFSGGPIITRWERRMRVVALVSGYRYDAPAPVSRRLPDGSFEETDDYFVRPNSGFMIATPISRAVACARRLIAPGA